MLSMAGLISVCRNWRERRDIRRERRRENVVRREWRYFKVQDDLNDALSALLQNDLRHARELWERALERGPGDARTSPLALKVLLPLSRCASRPVG
jgi:hypothetical protein